MVCNCDCHRPMVPSHIYAAFQKVESDLGTLRGVPDLRRFMVDEGYLWRAPTDQEWEAMRRDFHEHYEQRKEGGSS